MRVFVIGACYKDVILHVNEFPLEDSKTRAVSVETRRGGNGANMLQVLSQFSTPRDHRHSASSHSCPSAASSAPSSSTSTVPPPLPTVGAASPALPYPHPHNSRPSFSTFLLASLAGENSAKHIESSLILSDLVSNNPRVSLQHCVFRGDGYQEPTAWIVATPHSRTVVNHSTLPEMTADEFRVAVEETLTRAFEETTNSTFETPPQSLWFHFEGRNISQVSQMVTHLLQAREKLQELAKQVDVSRNDWWKCVDAVGSGGSSGGNSCSNSNSASSNNNSNNSNNNNNNTSISGGGGGDKDGVLSPGGKAVGRRESRETIPPRKNSNNNNSSINKRPTFTISIEFEKPTRVGIDELLGSADVLFFSKHYAEARGYRNAPTGFLDNIRRETQRDAIMFVTWSEKGAFYMVNRGAKGGPCASVHVSAPQVFLVDTIGAGDTFVAGCVYGFLCGDPVGSVCEFAVRLATAKCAQVGFDGLAERVLGE